MGVRPSELYGIDWPVAAFYLDRGLSAWASFVETKVNEAGNAVASTAVGRSSGGHVFVQSARQAQFSRLLGLSDASAYRQPQIASRVEAKPKSSGSQTFSGEGNFDLSKFNG
jgi:hypothetical protein